MEPDRSRTKAPRGAFFILAVLALLASGTSLAACDSGETVQVRHVVDGDTVILTDGRHVRLIGINSPELGKAGTADEPLAAAARERLSDLVRGQTLRLRAGRDPVDRYGRRLADLCLADGRSVQEILLGEGLASTIVVPPNTEHAEAFMAREAEARRARRGLWGERYYAPLPADRIHGENTGFRFVTGRVQAVGHGRKYYYFDLAPQFSLQVSREDWSRYFAGRPDTVNGRYIEARGWVRAHDDKLRLQIRHPAMWNVSDTVP